MRFSINDLLFFNPVKKEETVKKNGNGSSRLHDVTAAEAQAEAAKNLRKLSAERLPVYYADADEERDPLELRGFSIVPDNIAAPAMCPCSRPWHECDACEQFADNEEVNDAAGSFVDEDDEARRFRRFLDKAVRIESWSVESSIQTRHDAWLEQWEIGPTSRGARVTAELNRSGRMRF